jgi:adenylate cyclase
MTEVRTQRRLAAILAADVAGYSKMMGADEAGTLAVLRMVWAERFNPAVGRHGGRIVKMMGDGALVEFGSAVDAVECAVAVQAAMAEFNAKRDGQAIEFRIGVNLGDIVIEGDDIFGDGVNVAARLESQAPKNGVLVSDGIHVQVRGKVAVEFTDAGALALKNIAEPVRAWRWGGDGMATVAVAAAETEEGPSIAVLPFDNMSNDPEQEYFSDGISEDIITDLSKVAGLMVVARNSSFAYKGRTRDVRVVGRELGVRSVLEGSIRRAGNRVRISAQLIDTRTGGHLWADRFDRDLTDIFAVQDEVTLQIVGALKVTLRPAERAALSVARVVNVEAHDIILRARELSSDLLRNSSNGRENIEKLVMLLRQAIELDPDNAQPYAYLAMTYMVEFNNRWAGIPDPEGLAAHFADIAVRLDPNDPVACNASAVAQIYTGQLEGAREQAERGVALNPNFANGLGTLGNIEIFMGNPDAAIPLLERAIRLDPVFTHHYTHFLGLAHLVAGRDAEAVACFRERVRLAPGTDLSRSFLVSALGHQGKTEEAQQVWQELRALNPAYSAAEHIGRLPFRRPGDRERLSAGLALAGVGL